MHLHSAFSMESQTLRASNCLGARAFSTTGDHVCHVIPYVALNFEYLVVILSCSVSFYICLEHLEEYF